MLTIREQLQLMDSIKAKNDAAFAKAAKRQKFEMWRTWIETLVAVGAGCLLALVVMWVASW